MVNMKYKYANKWNKDLVMWEINKTLYISAIFSWELPQIKKIATSYNGKVIIGGPASQLFNNIDWAIQKKECIYDVLSMHNPLATFTTRGCIRKCKFCVVPKIEGEFKELDDWKIAPIVCDNNILASSKKHFKKVIESLKKFEGVDFNQGLDARLLNSWHLNELQKLKHVKLRFAFDSIKYEKSINEAVNKVLNAGFPKKNLSIYVLIGFNDTPEDAKYRLDKVLSWGAQPCPMRYQPIDSQIKNSYVGKNWTDYELKKMVKYYWKIRFLSNVNYKDFEPNKTESLKINSLFK